MEILYKWFKISLGELNAQKEEQESGRSNLTAGRNTHSHPVREAWSTRVCQLRKIIKVGDARPGKSTLVPAEYHPVTGLGGCT